MILASIWLFFNTNDDFLNDNAVAEKSKQKQFYKRSPTFHEVFDSFHH